MRLTNSPQAEAILLIAMLVCGPARAALVNIDLAAVPGTYFVVDLASELGLSPGSEVYFGGIGWDFTVTTLDLAGIGRAGFDFPDEFCVTIRRDELPTTTSSTVAVFSLDSTGFFISDGLLTMGLLALVPTGQDGGFSNDQSAIWSGTLTLSVTAVPLPGALWLLLSAIGGAFAFVRRNNRLSTPAQFFGLRAILSGKVNAGCHAVVPPRGQLAHLAREITK